MGRNNELPVNNLRILQADIIMSLTAKAEKKTKGVKKEDEADTQPEPEPHLQ